MDILEVRNVCFGIVGVVALWKLSCVRREFEMVTFGSSLPGTENPKVARYVTL